MQNPHHVSDAYDQKLCDMVDADDAAFESICEQLLSPAGVADYYDKDGHQMIFLDQIKEDFGQEIEEGKSIIEIINNVVNEIVESIRG